MSDLRFMQLALALGRRGLGNAWPNPAVGAVLVRDGEILARAWTQPGGRPHAETQALGRAGESARGATLYVTLEPCSHHGRTPPCADAIIAHGVARVVSALEDPNPQVGGQGHERLRRHGIVVEVGVGGDEARRVHAGHIRRIRDGRPHVTLKLAVSSDGKAGLAGRRPVAITGERAREMAHRMRAMNDAILIGIGTALADDPLLTCRLPGVASPVRIVLDSALRLPLDSRLVRGASDVPVWVVTMAKAASEAEQALVRAGVRVFRLGANADGLDLAAVLQCLALEGITRLMVEGGPKVAAGFLRADLVDAATVFRSQNPIGADGIDALEGMRLEALTESRHFVPAGADKAGDDTISFFERA